MPNDPSAAEPTRACAPCAAASRTGWRGASLRWLGAHWRGAHSLTVSIWGGCLPLLLAQLALQASLHTRYVHARADYLLPLVVVALQLTLLAALWALAGVWRAASRLGLQPRRRRRARMAQAMALIGMVAGPVILLNNSITLARIVRSGALIDGLRPLSFTLSGDGQTLRASGAFRFGSADRFIEQFDAHPGLKWLELDSYGGLLGEARLVARQVRQRALSTRVLTQCDSACTLVFMAGVQRELGAQVRLGFHGPVALALPRADLREVALSIAAEMQADGATAGFAARAVAVVPPALWRPSYQELLSNGVVTRVLPGATAAVDGLAVQN